MSKKNRQNTGTDIKQSIFCELVDIEFCEDSKNMSLHFKKGIDPEVILDALEKIDG